MQKAGKRAKKAKKASLAIVETITRARELMRKSQHMINLINKRDNFRDLITISWKKRDHPIYITVDVWIYQHHPEKLHLHLL